MSTDTIPLPVATGTRKVVAGYNAAAFTAGYINRIAVNLLISVYRRRPGSRSFRCRKGACARGRRRSVRIFCVRQKVGDADVFSAPANDKVCRVDIRRKHGAYPVGCGDGRGVSGIVGKGDLIDIGRILAEFIYSGRSYRACDL